MQKADHPIIWTNMRFWQSPLWQRRVRSIYPCPDGDAVPDAEFSALTQAWRLWKRRRQSDLVITMGIRESMAYATLCAITGVRSKQVMTEIFVDPPQPQRWSWRLKTNLYGQLARRAVGVIVNSEPEIQTVIDRFGVRPDRVAFVPLCSTIAPERVLEPEQLCVLAAGRTLRDFSLLLKVAGQLAPTPVCVICGMDDCRDEDIPKNAEILREVDRFVYLQRLRQATCVVIPLLPTERSTGQVVLLEAMALGKPVIATRSPGTVDYIRDGETGMLVEPGNESNLRTACETLLRDPAMCRRMGAAAQAHIKKYGRPDDYAEALLQVLANFS